MTVATAATSKIMRRRFGAWLKEQREARGLTQLDLAVALDFAYPTMVSQIERGITAMPTHDLRGWSEALGVAPKDLAEKFLYFMEPNIWAALHGRNPHDIEKLPRSASTLQRRSELGKKAAR